MRIAAPSLNPPRLGDPIDSESSYVRRESAERQAGYWNEELANDPVMGPKCGLVVGVSPIRVDRRYRLVWVAK